MATPVWWWWLHILPDVLLSGTFFCSNKLYWKSKPLNQPHLTSTFYKIVKYDIQAIPTWVNVVPAYGPGNYHCRSIGKHNAGSVYIKCHLARNDFVCFVCVYHQILFHKITAITQTFQLLRVLSNYIPWICTTFCSALIYFSYNNSPFRFSYTSFMIAQLIHG